MGKITEILDSYDGDILNIGELYEIFKSVDEIPTHGFILGTDGGFVRQRENGENEIFSRISDLSCPPALCIKKHGRANLPYQPMFYACTGFDKRQNLNNEKEVNKAWPRLIALYETSDFCKDEHSSGRITVTTSIWKSREILKLISLPFSDSYKNPCSLVRELSDAWSKIRKNPNTDPDGLELAEYMSAEIAKEFSEENEYVKIANFIYYLLYVCDKTKYADGIVYPSVQAQGAGFNIAIKPDIFYEKIYFVHAALCHLSKIGENRLLTEMKRAKADSDGNLTYIDRQLSEEEKQAYSQYSAYLGL